jgi:hypothetical protein
MSGVQIPLWVTYSLAVIAILGPIGGALLGARYTAKRDDKRWDREREREEVRWERERQRLADERVHQKQLHWSEKRAEAYGAYMVALDGWISHARYLTQVPRVLPDPERLTEMEQFCAEMHELTGVIQLVTGLEDIRWKVSETVGVCQMFQVSARNVKRHEHVDQIVPDSARVIKLRYALFELFRQEVVAAEPSTQVEPSNPSPPSETTS